MEAENRIEALDADDCTDFIALGDSSFLDLDATGEDWEYDLISVEIITLSLWGECCRPCSPDDL